MITKEQALTALDNMDDYAKMSTSIDPVGARKTLELYILQEEERAEDATKLYEMGTKEFKGAVRYFVACLIVAISVAVMVFGGAMACQT